MKLLDSIVVVCLALYKIATLFSKAVVLSYIATIRVYMIQFSISSPTFVVNTIFKVHFSHSNRFVVIPYCCFNCIFLSILFH